MDERIIIDEFHRLLYSKGQIKVEAGGSEDVAKVGLTTTYCGMPIQKNPMDLWVYQEILWECRPDLVIEMGTWSGASALYLAHHLDLIGDGSIITVDIENRLARLPNHPRIFYMIGDSVNPLMLSEIEIRARKHEKVMLILDDEHTTEHVYKELEMYHGLVTTGQYLIVEDTNVDCPLGFGNGPGEAVAQFLTENDKFFVDERREKFLVTWNPGGYLRRI